MKIKFTFLFVLIFFLACERGVDTDSNEKNNKKTETNLISLSQKGLPLTEVDIEWDVGVFSPKRNNDLPSRYFESSSGKYYSQGSVYYASNLRDERIFFFPDKVRSASFKFDKPMSMSGTDHILLSESLATNNQYYMYGYNYNCGRDYQSAYPCEGAFNVIHAPDLNMSNDEQLYNAKVSFNTSDLSSGDRGWSMNRVQFAYDSSITQRQHVYPMDKNRGYDIVTIDPGDELYFKANIDPNKDNIIHLKMLAHRDTNDFDVYLKGGDPYNVHIPGPQNFDFKGTKGYWNGQSGNVARNELVNIPAGTFPSNINRLYITVRSNNGKGHARLFVNETTRVGLSAAIKIPGGSNAVDPSVLDDLILGSRGDVWAAMSRRLYEATDGQLLVSRFNIHMQGCNQFCDVYLIPPRGSNVDRNGRYNPPFNYITIETRNERTDEVTGNIVEYSVSSESIAGTFSHEYGHRLQIADEYGPTINGELKPLVGHTIMMGTNWGNGINLRDFSVPHNYDKNPYIDEHGNVNTGGPINSLDDWTHLSQNYPYLNKTTRIVEGLNPSHQKYEDFQVCPPNTSEIGVEDIDFKSLVSIEIIDSNGSSHQPLPDGFYQYPDDCGPLF